MFIALAMIIDRRRTLFKDIMYEREVHEAMNTKLKINDKLVPFQLYPKLFSWGRVERELADCSSSIQC